MSSSAARSADAAAIGELAARLPELTLRDQQRIGRRLDGARRVRGPEARAAVAAELAVEIDRAELRIEQRRQAVPEIRYPAELPVSQKKDDILAAIRDHQVVIVAGETGSGKTTQIPKICLELGRGVKGLVGHTQPRRIAARTVAERVAEEIGTPLGETVGWKVRFTDQVGQDTLVKLMTDGILLAEIQTDRELRQYDTLIIDEAHERSLNIDFILGYLKQLLRAAPTSRSSSPRRPSTRSGSPATSATPRSSRSPAAPIPSRSATGRLSTTPPTPRTATRRTATATRSKRSATPPRSCRPRARATSWSSSPASARSATPPTPSTS